MTFLKKCSPVFKQFIRYRSQRRSLGKAPGVARTLQQRLAELNYEDPSIHYKVDIGFRHSPSNRSHIEERKRLLKENKNNPQLEKLSRKHDLLIPIEEVEEDTLNGRSGCTLVQLAAEHYNIYQDLFGDAYFTPVKRLDIDYKSENSISPVYRGNILSPSDTISAPEVYFDSPKDSLWTLVLTSPDGNLSSETSEYVLWLKGNIVGNDIKTGEVIRDYLPPFPLKGIGYCRYVFVLYKQDKEIDFSSLGKTPAKCTDPSERLFSTYEFYRDRQDVLTPAGLRFFQAEWDPSVTELFHKQFNREAPVFEYDFPKHYYTPQKWFPIKQPFNLYLDRYRDEKQIAKEYIIKKLKRIHPFKGPERKLPYPNAVVIKRDTPSWLKNEIRKERLGWARINDY